MANKIKIIVVQFAETVDITPFVAGDDVTVTKGVATITGSVMFATPIALPPASAAPLVPHTHEIAGSAMISGSAPVSGITGPAVP